MFAVTNQGDPRGRVVVVSPHLDDGVLSLGASIAFWSRRGAHVVLLTVLGGDPRSSAPTRGWDRRAGYETEGEAARARRDEDRAACTVLGASPVWLPFGSVDYERHAEDEEICDAVTTAVNRADTILLPGFPLTHPDHAWLTRILVEGSLLCEHLGFYAEQPYAYREGALEELPAAPEWLRNAAASRLAFERIRVAPRDRFAKLRAIRRYRSQLGLLALNRHAGVPPLQLLWSETRRGGEAVAWVSGRRQPHALDR